MRIGHNPSDDFTHMLSETNSKIQEKFSKAMNRHIRAVPVKVMLGDATVTSQETFDPQIIHDYFEGIIGGLEGWQVRPTTITNNEDIRRIFTKFEVLVGNYVLVGHISLQFHVLLYYKPDNRVLGAQKELASIMDSTREKESFTASESDRRILSRLEEMGYGKLADDRLFEVLFNDDALRDSVLSGLDEDSGARAKATSRKQELFDELDGLLMETYQTSPVLIDDARLVTGEEGYLCTFDIEFVKNKIREGTFETRKISDTTRKQMASRLAEFESLV